MRVVAIRIPNVKEKKPAMTLPQFAEQIAISNVLSCKKQSSLHLCAHCDYTQKTQVDTSICDFVTAVGKKEVPLEEIRSGFEFVPGYVDLWLCHRYESVNICGFM